VIFDPAMERNLLDFDYLIILRSTGEVIAKGTTKANTAGYASTYAKLEQKNIVKLYGTNSVKVIVGKGRFSNQLQLDIF
jgi:hypothetical protein